MRQDKRKHTLMEPIHIELSDEGRDVGMFKVLSVSLSLLTHFRSPATYARTFENSGEGDMTKLSFEDDQEIK